MTVAASLKALVTLAEFVVYLNQSIASYSSDQQDALQRLINAVSEALENHCGVPLIKAAATEYYDGGRSRILLGRCPVDTSSAFTVLEDGIALTPAADGSSKTAGGAEPDFYLDPDTGVIERNGTWASGKRIVKVTYTAGVARQVTTGGGTRTGNNQSLDSVEGPDDLREACLIVCRAHTDLGPANFGVQFLENGRMLRPDAWPLLARKLLDNYTYSR